MTRGHPPYVAISEAERKAAAMGYSVYAVDPGACHPFHFITIDKNCVCLNRVRRLNYPGFDPAQIEASCRNDIAELRSITITQEIFRELWVRGSDRHWYRYLVLPDSVEFLEDDEDHQEENGKKDGGKGSISSIPLWKTTGNCC